MITINISSPGLPDGHDLTLDYPLIIKGMIEAERGTQIEIVKVLLAQLNDSVTESTKEATRLAYKGFLKQLNVLL